MRHRLARIVPFASALLAATAAISGCAGSGGGTGATEFTLTAFANGARTGSASSTGSSTTSFVMTGDSGAPTAIVPQGDVTPQGDIGNQSLRGLLSFTLPVTPPGVTIVSATLVVYPIDYNEGPSVELASVVGLFGTMGNVVADHVDLGAALDGTDYGSAALQSNVATILTSEVFGAVSVDVTSSVLDDESNFRPRSEYRLRFTNPTDGDPFQDTVEFGNALSKGSEPRLIITYSVPNGVGLPYLPDSDSEDV